MQSQVSEKTFNLFMNGVVSFTQFIYTIDSLTLDELSVFFLRKSAVFCKRNQQAIDLIIPVLLEEGFSAIIVQCRNYASTDSKMPGAYEFVTLEKSCLFSNIETEAEQPPYLSLYLQTGKGSNASLMNLKETKATITLGTKISNLEENIRAAKSSRIATNYATELEKHVDELKALRLGLFDPRQMIVGVTNISCDVYPCLSETVVQELQQLSDSFVDPVKTVAARSANEAERLKNVMATTYKRYAHTSIPTSLIPKPKECLGS